APQIEQAPDCVVRGSWRLGMCWPLRGRWPQTPRAEPRCGTPLSEGRDGIDCPRAAERLPGCELGRSPRAGELRSERAGVARLTSASVVSAERLGGGGACERLGRILKASRAVLLSGRRVGEIQRGRDQVEARAA